jgi:uncharacterized protein (TIGR02145 family)
MKNFIKLIGISFFIFISFLCSCEKKDSNSVSDIDGNIYNTVKIGTQVWMVENLKVTKYRNGDPITKLNENAQWTTVKTGAYCSYDNASTPYGLLYNGYTVSDIRGIAPDGWHVPSDAEWTILIDFLGGNDVAGNKLKEKGTANWSAPNTGATNESGFTALPGGYRHFDNGAFYFIYRTGYWWSTSISSAGYLGGIHMYDYTSNLVTTLERRNSGYSIRCIKD